jgi:hypothetical protein
MLFGKRGKSGLVSGMQICIFGLLKLRGMNYIPKSQWGLAGSALKMVVCYVTHQGLIIPAA